ncbi:peptidoglycan-binding protein [Streptomyces sp. NBC_01431]|uniref:peptidoglycan-binding protein n=1 Tax=Streptomyces sp. NBC_01431 TaxID=2903863 RepID=UPI002E3520BD|nr:peptidoglycan-binding protein [Streptomyces sp. NBC_01431]
MDGRSGCSCAERAAETLHAERSAQAAATEDFDPLRIRPYVTLPNAEAAPVAGGGVTPPLPPGTDETLPLRALPAQQPAPRHAVSDRGAKDAPSAAFTATELRYSNAEEADPSPPVRGGLSPSAKRGSAPRRRLAALAVGAAAAVAIATAAFTGDLFAGDAAPKRALPGAADPAVPYSAAETGPAQTPSAVASRTKKAVAHHSAAPKPSAPPSPPASGPTSPRPSKAAPTPSASPQPSDGPRRQPLAPAGGTLRRGDSGPQVLELQERLSQLGLYSGNPDGTYGSRTERAVSAFQSDAGVEGDPAGVYGPQTRRALESMTDQP